MILHLAQRFRMDGETFIENYSLQLPSKAEVLIIHAHISFV